MHALGALLRADGTHALTLDDRAVLQRYGGPQRFLNTIGVRDEQQARLRANLLEGGDNR